MRTQRLLAILGSPHADGITAAMLQCAVAAAERAGWQIDRIDLYQQEIGYCIGCRTCIKTGQCVQNDSIQKIAALLQTCDAVVLAAPTYWGNVPAIVKNMFDRLLGVAMDDTGTLPAPRLSKRQKYCLLTSCNTPFPFSRWFGQSSGCLRAMEEFFKYAGMKKMGAISCDGVKTKKVLPPSIAKRIRSVAKFESNGQTF